MQALIVILLILATCHNVECVQGPVGYDDDNEPRLPGQRGTEDDDDDSSRIRNPKDLNPPNLIRGKYNMSYCDFEYGGYCGTQMVPLDRYKEKPLGSIPIGFQYYPRFNASYVASRGLLTPQEGGPGFSTVGSKNDYLRVFKKLRQGGWDILLLDKRGTGKSAAVDCPGYQRSNKRSLLDVSSCSRHWNTSYYYSTLFAVSDMVQVVQNLGYERLSYYGDSYGTVFGTVLAVTYPNIVEAMVLDSAYPIRNDNQDYELTSGIANLDIVCSRSPWCPKRKGGRPATTRLAELVALMRRLDIGGIGTFGVNKTCTLKLNPQAYPSILLGVGEDYTVWRELDSANRALLDYLAHRKTGKLQEHAAPLLRLLSEAVCDGGHSRYTEFSAAIQIGLDCQEWSWPYSLRLSPSERRRQFEQSLDNRRLHNPWQFYPFTVDEVNGAQNDAAMWDSCIPWSSPPEGMPVGEFVSPKASFARVKFPVLVLNGELDTATSPTENAQAAAQFPKAWVRHIQAPNMVHEVTVFSGSPSSGDLANCIAPNVNKFFANRGDFSTLDWQCIKNIRPVRVVPKFAVTVQEMIVVPTLINTTNNDTNTNTSSETPLPSQLALKLVSVACEAVGDALVRVGDAPAAGLRGGKFSVKSTPTGQLLTLDSVKWTVDSVINGRVTWNQLTGIVTANLTAFMLDPLPLRVEEIGLQWNDLLTNARVTVSASVGGVRFSAIRTAP